MQGDIQLLLEYTLVHVYMFNVDLNLALNLVLMDHHAWRFGMRTRVWPAEPVNQECTAQQLC